MEQDTNITDVVFRADKAGDFKGVVFALLPHEVDDRNGNVTSYQHIGQHSSADYIGCISSSRPATQEEYSDLKAEMEDRGYNLNVVQKQNRDKYIASYDALRKQIG